MFLFEKVAIAGHSFSKLCHGLHLYNGWYGVSQNKLLGMKFIKEAVKDGVEGAEDELKKLESQL